MSNVGYASLQIIPSADGFGKHLSQQTSGPMVATGKEGGKKFGGGMIAAAKGFVGPLAAVMTVGAGVSFFKGAITEASGLGESVNALNVVYGENSSGIQALGKEAATSLGLSNLEFNNLAVRFSAFSKNIAGEGGDVTGTLDALTTRASDFASVMNLEVADAAQLFQSGLAGESEPLRAYGIDMSAAAVEAYALANGIADAGGTMSEEQKQIARYGLLMEQTSQTAGDFANTSDSLANRQRILSSRFADLKVGIGNALIPALNGLVGFALDHVLPMFERLGGGLGALKSLIVDGDFTGAFRDAFGIEEDSPVIAVILNVRTAVMDLFASLRGGGEGGGASAILQTLAGAAQTLLPHLVNIGTTIVSTVWPILQQLGSFIIANVVPILTTVGNIITGTVIPAVIDFASFVANDLLPKVSALWQSLSSNLQPVLDSVTSFITGSVIPAVQQIADKFREWQPTIQAVIGVVVTVIAKVVEFAGAILGKVIPPIIAVAGFLLRTLVGAVVGTIDVVVKIIAKVIEFGGSLGTAGGKLAEFAGAVRDKIGDAIGYVRELPGKASAALGNLKTTLLSAGSDLVSGFINGITGMKDRIIGAVKSTITNALPDFVKDALGIKSPSRVFMALGEHVAEGMAVGIAGGARDVQRAADSLVPSTPDVFASPAVTTSVASAIGAARPGGEAPGFHVHGDVYTHDLDEFKRYVEARESDASTLYGLAGVLP